jgi:hypothetical protein
MTKIENVVVPSKGIGKYFSIRAINIQLPGTGATFYWEVLTEETEPHESDEQPVKHPGQSILSGNLAMGATDYVEWGSDDQDVINWALQQLGFTEL